MSFGDDFKDADPVLCQNSNLLLEVEPAVIRAVRYHVETARTRVWFETSGTLFYTHYSPDPLTLVIDFPGVDITAISDRIVVRSQEVESIIATRLDGGGDKSLSRIEIRLSSLVPSKGEQASLRKRLQSAYNRPEYKEALAALDQLHDELEERNQSAAASLEEGIEETLTLHRLGVYGVLGRSFKTTNCLESVNALVEERCAKVDHWKNSSQRQRWLATALVDIEPRLRRVIGYRHLPKLREALKRELKIETKTSTVSKKKAA